MSGGSMDYFFGRVRDVADSMDTTSLDSWDAERAFAAMTGLWSKANRDERLLLAKMYHIMNMALVEARKRDEDTPGKPKRRRRRPK